MKLSAAGAAFFAAARLLAHAFWIEPSTFRPEVGATVGIALRVGEGFRGDPVPRTPGRIIRFVLVSPSGETPVEGVTGHDPAGVARVSESGLQLVGYRSNSSKVELEAEKFEQYLKEEGSRGSSPSARAAGSRKSHRGKSIRAARSRSSPRAEPESPGTTA